MPHYLLVMGSIIDLDSITLFYLRNLENTGYWSDIKPVFRPDSETLERYYNVMVIRPYLLI